MEIKNISNRVQCVSGFPSIKPNETIKVSKQDADHLSRNPFLEIVETKKAIEVEKEKPTKKNKKSEE